MSKYLRRNRIGEQFATRTVRMLESPAYRVLSIHAHRILARIEIELAHHGGRENGKLPVTFDHFVEYGVRRHSVAPAIRELEALGFIEVTEQGRAGNAEWRRPNKFRLTYRHLDRAKPTNEWERIETNEEAEMIAKAARRLGWNSANKPAPENKTPVTVLMVFSVETVTKNRHFIVRKPSLLAIVRKPSLPLESRVGVGKRRLIYWKGTPRAASLP